MRRGLPSGRLPLRFQFALGRWWARHISRKHDPEGIRKQVYDLTLEDFEASPVWEFCLDEEGEPGQDEETVRPRPELAQVDPEQGLFVVAATFRASDDQEYSGFVNPVQAGDAEVEFAALGPTIITAGEHVQLWLPAVRGQKAEGRHESALTHVYRATDNSSAGLFPLRWATAVRIDGGPSAGELLGLSYVRETPERGPGGKRRWRRTEEVKT
jgi:hypothetical protein